ncbi:hypothetical protein T459_18158 [Capsicum annuum]|uniref:Uncharacterized protein n=1 Tax=Capsicum annuum TaxID=4072 RepID=A0A2G2ZDN0_CAPAN|nr:hypothetical protein T459_18158 [Capsicum annuum]
MGNRTPLLLVLVLFSTLVASVVGYEYEGRREREEEEESEQRTQGEKWFMLRQLHDVVKTDARSMRMVNGGYRRGSFLHSPMHLSPFSPPPPAVAAPAAACRPLAPAVAHPAGEIAPVTTGEQAPPPFSPLPELIEARSASGFWVPVV